MVSCFNTLGDQLLWLIVNQKQYAMPEKDLMTKAYDHYL